MCSGVTLLVVTLARFGPMAKISGSSTPATTTARDLVELTAEVNVQRFVVRSTYARCALAPSG